MSKLKAAILTAILGSSTAAMASPSLSFNADAQFSWGTTGMPVIRDHRTTVTPAAYQTPSSQSTFIKLASALDLSSGRDLLRMQGMNLRNADGLTLRVNYGQGFIDGIQVRYRNGRSETINVDQWMTTRTPAINVALRGNRDIDSISILGSAEGRLSYQVFASVDDNFQVDTRPDPIVQPARSPQLLGTVTQIVNAGTPLEFFIGGYQQAPQQIMLSSNGGKSRIFDVTVKFADGTKQLFHLDRYVGSKGSVDLPYSPTYTLQLSGNRRVTSVVIDGLNAANSSYSVYAI